MYTNANKGINNDDYAKKMEIKKQIIQHLKNAGVPNPICDFREEYNSDIEPDEDGLEGVAIGSAIERSRYFGESGFYHDTLPILSPSQADAINAAANLTEVLLTGIGGHHNFRKTVGLALHGGS
jgi:hypothetical protein